MFFFFFNDTATTEIYTLSLHDALPILDHIFTVMEPREPGVDFFTRACTSTPYLVSFWNFKSRFGQATVASRPGGYRSRSEEHTSELQSRQYFVCRLLLEKKKKKTIKLC